MKILNVTENGSGRIIFSETPGNIIGLAIRGLETCTGIVILGDKGISVIHDESYLSIDSIEQEFAFVGNFREWAIFFHPDKLNNSRNELSKRQVSMAPIIKKYQAYYIGGSEGSLFRASSSGCLTVLRTITKISEIDTNFISPESIIEPKSPLMTEETLA